MGEFTMLRRAILTTVLLFAMMGAAFAQLSSPGVHLRGDKPTRTKEQKEYDKALDRAYQSAVKKIPDPEKKSADPWTDIRPSSSEAAKKKQ
jgi:uncharacterized protein YecT (DUF1311 family)